jgi:CYTH domain-containing protein
VEIIQTYLKSRGKAEVRVRQRGADGSYIYTRTEKTAVSDIKRIEVEKRLTKEEYLDLLMDADTSLRQIRKTRYCLTCGSQYFEIDLYPFWNDRAVMEIELRSEDETVVFPEFIDVKREITGDERYKNRSLARPGSETGL